MAHNGPLGRLGQAFGAIGGAAAGQNLNINNSIDYCATGMTMEQTVGASYDPRGILSLIMKLMAPKIAEHERTYALEPISVNTNFNEISARQRELWILDPMDPVFGDDSRVHTCFLCRTRYWGNAFIPVRLIYTFLEANTYDQMLPAEEYDSLRKYMRMNRVCLKCVAAQRPPSI